MDFSVYGTIYNQTYYDLTPPSFGIPTHGYWKLKCGSINAGGTGSFQLADNSGCHGSQGKVSGELTAIYFGWNFACPFGRGGSNSITPFATASAQLSSSASLSKDGPFGAVPKSGHPLYAHFSITHNSQALLPTNTQQRQSQANWCWAACASMLAAYYRFSGSDETCSQCSIVTSELGAHCCGPLGPTEICNQTAQDAQLTQVLQSLQIATVYSAEPPTWMALDVATTAFNPAIIGISWGANAGGHVALVVGVDASGDVVVYDPATGIYTAPYDDIINRYMGAGIVDATWTTSFPRPWVAEETPGRDVTVEAVTADVPDSLERRDVLVVRVPPTDEGLVDPANRSELLHGEIHRVALGDVTESHLRIFDAKSGELSGTWKSAAFVDELVEALDAATALASTMTGPAEVAFVPLPFLKVHAVVVFSPDSRDQHAVFVLPAPHEAEFAPATPHAPSDFWASMRGRLALRRHTGAGKPPRG